MYEAAEKINYLDYTIQESLRLYPPAVTYTTLLCCNSYIYSFLSYSISRLCVTPTVIGGVDIPRGTQVHIPIKQLHYDLKYWNNPKKFDPQRYTGSKHDNFIINVQMLQYYMQVLTSGES